MPCIACMIALYLLFLLPLLISDRPRCYRQLHCCRVRLRRRGQYPDRRASRQAKPLTLSHISPIYLYYSVALGIYCCYVTFLFNCIAYHCHPCYTFRILCSLVTIYNIQQWTLRLVSYRIKKRAVLTLG